MKKTPWFCAIDETPVRDGWYEANYYGHSEIVRRYWDGNEWLYTTFGMVRGDVWRGLTEPHK